jgi:hypothetical protein
VISTRTRNVALAPSAHHRALPALRHQRLPEATCQLCAQFILAIDLCVALSWRSRNRATVQVPAASVLGCGVTWGCNSAMGDIYASVGHEAVEEEVVVESQTRSIA